MRGMTLSSLQLAMNNLTTIENIDHRTKVWTLAIHIPRPHDISIDPQTQWAATFPTVTYPAQRNAALLRGQDLKPEDRRVFAILRTQPGENPWDLGSPLKNLQQVMGYTAADWLLPLKRSPCADHSSLESAFALGPVVQKLKQEAGLAPPPEQPTNAAVNGHQAPVGERSNGKKAYRLSRSFSSQSQLSDGIGPALPPHAHHAQHHSHDGRLHRPIQPSSVYSRSTGDF
ncbi:palmitoyltransferase pfa5 [Paecilomyces lecythidis]